MKFCEAEQALKDGKKIKLSTWTNAFWYIDPETDELMNHFEEGEEVPTHELFPRDMLWVMKDNWEIVGEGESQASSQKEALAAGDDKKISKAEYDCAVKEVIAQEVKDPNLQGMGKLLIPMVGMIFAKKISAALFDGESVDKEGSDHE